MVSRLLALTFALSLVTPLAAQPVDRSSEDARVLTIVNIGSLGAGDVVRLRETQGVLSWCEIEDTLLLLRKAGARFELPVGAWDRRDIPVRANLEAPMVAMRRGRVSPLDRFGHLIEVLHRQGSYTVFQTGPGVLKRLLSKQGPHFQLVSLEQSLVLRRSVRRLTHPIAPPPPSALRLDPADGERMKTRVTALEALKTRYTYAPGYLEAVAWTSTEFEALGYQVTRQEYDDYGKKQINVVAQKATTQTTDGFYIVCAHLDSTSPNPREDAPGADDNASGSAGVLEIAQLFAATEGARSLRFVLFAGEEAGMKGSRAYVKALKESGELARVKGVVNFDMIGFDGKSPLSALFETYAWAEPFVSPFVAAAQSSGVLEPSVSYNPWGSDHVPFLREKVPTFLLIEQEFEDNPNYHQTSDRVGAINVGLMKAIVDTVAGTLARFVCPAEPPSPNPPSPLVRKR